MLEIAKIEELFASLFADGQTVRSALELPAQERTNLPL
jgi:hypothetical protein